MMTCNEKGIIVSDETIEKYDLIAVPLTSRELYSVY